VIAAGADERLTAADLARLHGALGDAYADAALALAATAPRRPTVIGVHGQTVSHLPDERVTFRIGDAARVAVRTGITTVSDLRSADVAEGGQGAPLTPFADHVLFAKRAPLVVLNLGGIANVTLIPDVHRDHVLGFDTGPGNMVIDAVARRSGKPFDLDGQGAKRGRVIDAALRWALDHPFFSRAAPKSTGREEFGEAFADRLVREVRVEGGSLDDALATATQLTARTIAEAIRPTKVAWQELLVAGGGTRNGALMDELRRSLAPIPLLATDRAGIPTAAREAIAFAILAIYRLRGLPNTLPRVTGARHAVSAGAIHRP
jgi:anhydro-N-acetylmuramic acid kinase